MPTAAEPEQWLYLLRCAETGQHLRWSLELGSEAGDDACWRVESERGREGGWVAVGGSRRFTLVPSTGQPAAADPHGQAVRPTGGCPGVPEALVIVRGPAEPPSRSLRSLRDTGVAVLASLLHPEQVQRLRSDIAAMRAGPETSAGLPKPPTGNHRETYDDVICHSPVAAQAAVHPVLTFLLREYIGDIQLGHSPTVAIELAQPDLPPEADGGPTAAYGWSDRRRVSFLFAVCVSEMTRVRLRHADYPRGSLRDQRFPAEIVLGVETITCVSPFTIGNGATGLLPVRILRPKRFVCFGNGMAVAAAPNPLSASYADSWPLGDRARTAAPRV